MGSASCSLSQLASALGARPIYRSVHSQNADREVTYQIWGRKFQPKASSQLRSACLAQVTENRFLKTNSPKASPLRDAAMHVVSWRMAPQASARQWISYVQSAC